MAEGCCVRDAAILASEAEIAVIDCGTQSCRVGRAGEVVPYAVFPSIVGRPKNNTVVMPDQKDSYVGHEAEIKRGILTIRYPIRWDEFMTTNWDDMETIWRHAFYNELRLAPEESLVLISECVLNPKANRERMTQVMFETFNVPMLYICNSPVLSLYASGMTTGVVIDSGHSETHVVPIYDGFVLAHAKGHINVGGRDLTHFLKKMLAHRGYCFTAGYHDLLTVREIKETLCCVALDFNDVISIVPRVLTAHVILTETCIRVEITNMAGSELCVLDMELDSTYADLQTRILSKIPDMAGRFRILLPNGLDVSQLESDYALKLFGELTDASFHLQVKNQEPSVGTWVVMPPCGSVKVLQAPDPTSEVVSMETLTTVQGLWQGDWLKLSGPDKPGFISIFDEAGVEMVVEEGEHLQRYYDLNDGQVLTIGVERLLCPESLFQPHLLGCQCCGLSELTASSIMRCGEDIRKDLYSNIVLAGGNVMFTGLAERLVKELQALLPIDTEVMVAAPKEWSAWCGGSLFAASQLRQQTEKWMSIANYDEEGPCLVHSKCPI